MTNTEDGTFEILLRRLIDKETEWIRNKIYEIKGLLSLYLKL